MFLLKRQLQLFLKTYILYIETLHKKHYITQENIYSFSSKILNRTFKYIYIIFFLENAYRYLIYVYLFCFFIFDLNIVSQVKYVRNEYAVHLKILLKNSNFQIINARFLFVYI